MIVGQAWLIYNSGLNTEQISFFVISYLLNLLIPEHL
jgi:hypothetical protein